MRLRILQALGVDVGSHRAKVCWQVFLELYCIFEAGRLDPIQINKFWVKFFDQTLIGQVSEAEYMNVLEQLVRGNSLKKANKATKMFANMFKQILANAGCLSHAGDLMSEQLMQAFIDQKIDVAVLASTLGGRSSMRTQLE